MSTFYQKVAFITGAASGIGRTAALQLAARGAMVIATDVNEAGVEALAEEIRQQGGKAEYFRLDVTDYHAVRTLIRYCVNNYKRLDYAFCNAGIGVAGEVRDIPIEDWERVLSVNLNGVIYTATEAYKVMVEQGFGHIVTTASLAGLTYAPVLVPYLTTKHAVVAFSRALRLEGKDLGVRVSAFCPGYISTNIYESSLYSGASFDELMALNQVKKIPVEEAVEQLLKGVAENRELIVMPLYGKLLSWMTRFSYPIVRSFSMQELARFRTVRKVPIRQGETVENE